MLVLIANADTSEREAGRRAVEQFGYRCTLTSDGPATWDRIVSDYPDVVLLSFASDTIDGLELCRKVRDLRRSPPCYVVAMIDGDDAQQLSAAMMSGADDFLIQPPSHEQLHARLQVAERVALLYREIKDQHTDLERARRDLRASVRTDPLTQLWNRIQFNDDLDLFQGQLLRYGHRYAAAIIDLDRFRAYNDIYGQLTGDEALRVIAQVVAGQLRTGDRAYRYGGDQLVVLLPEQTPESALIVACRIKEAVQALALPHPGNAPGNILTVSAGVAAFPTDERSSYEALLGRAEAALRLAKADGGNAVAVDDGTATDG